jgi:transposase
MKIEERSLVTIELVHAYLSGVSVRDIAKKLGVSIGTVSNYLKRPKVQYLIRTISDSSFQQSVDMLNESQVKAVKALVESLDSGDKDRAGIAAKIITIAHEREAVQYGRSQAKESEEGNDAVIDAILRRMAKDHSRTDTEVKS